MSGEGSRHKSPFEILNTCHEMLKYFVALCFQNPKLCFRNKRETRTMKVIFQQLEMQDGGGMANDSDNNLNFYVNFRDIA